MSGALPPGWSAPSPVWLNGSYQTGGVVWLGLTAATEEDIANLKRVGGKPDEGTLVGRHHPDWISFASLHSKVTKLGGKGSTTYQLQYVGSGVQFANKSIWYWVGKSLKRGIPDRGFHRGWMNAAIEGPEPDSIAATILGEKGRYVWDSDLELWTVVVDLEGAEA